MSARVPPYSGKPPTSTPTPRAKTPTAPGLGDKMRSETSKTLEQMLKKGAFVTGLETLIKVAKGALPMPAARPSPSWTDMHAGVAKQQAANVNALPAPLPAARTMRDELSMGHGGGTTPPVAPGSRGSGGGAGGARGLLGRFKMPRMGGTLGLMGLGAAGAMAYGVHKSNAHDRERNPLVYAPMQGTVMQ